MSASQARGIAALRGGMVKILLTLLLVAGAGLATPATAQNVRLTKLTDVNFGALTTTANDVWQAQDVCAFVQSLSGRYNIRATGSGTGGAFTLANGSSALPYEVQWNGSAGQTSGTNLTPGVALGGLTAVTVNQSCTLLIASSASLIIMLRAAALSRATAGSYAGTLTLIIAAE